MRDRAVAAAPGYQPTTVTFTAQEEADRDAEEAIVANIIVLRNADADVTTEKLTASADNVATIVVEVQKRDRGGTNQNGSNETVICCPVNSQCKVDASSKTLNATGSASFTFGPVDGLIGQTSVMFDGGVLGSRRVIIEWV